MDCIKRTINDYLTLYDLGERIRPVFTGQSVFSYKVNKIMIFLSM